MSLVNSATYRSAPSVRVAKSLRMAFGLIVILMLLGLMFGGVQLHKLQKMQRNSIDQSVPTLIRSQVVESQIASLFTLTEKFRTEIYNSHALAVYKEIKLLQGNIEKTVATELEFGLQVDELEELLLLVESLGSDTDGLLPIRLQLIANDQSLDAYEIRLDMVRFAFLELFEQQTIMMAAELTMSDNYIINEQQVRKKIDFQNELTELYIRLTTVIDISDQLISARSTSLKELDTSKIQQNLKSVAQVLVAIDDDVFRKDVAKLVKRLQAIIFGEHGIVDRMKYSINWQKHSNEVRYNQIEVSRKISELNRSIVAATRLHVTKTSADFASTLKYTTLMVLVSEAAIALVILFTIYFVVERQFNQRISKLTEAVMGIAAGDVNYKVGISGKDEIGLMANALAVFKDNAKKLLRSNQDLEQFAYAASHDLRSPLRAIENLAQWTMDDSGETLTDDCRDNLTKLIERAKRLSTLQTDLLDYAKTGIGQEDIIQITVTDIVNDLSGILDPSGKYKVDVHNGDKTVLTHATPFRQVLLNLYNNAMKHNDVETGKLQIEVTYTEDRMTILFIDNGPGIETQYHAHVFELFKRLKSQDVVEGSGLGLSLVRKLIERQDGRIEVISNPAVSRGTTFKFDWPIL